MSKEIRTVPNQRTIKVNKELCNKDNYYATINLSALQAAMQILKNSAFKFWIYLSKNQDGHTFALSKVDTLRWCGFSERTYTAAFAELEQLGYLVRRKDGSNHYDFYEIPVENKEEPVITVNKASNSAENGFIF